MRKKIVLFGGGTGLSNVLASIKNLDADITAVVTIADNGGSTGKIRSYYDIPAPGDLRRCALALCDDEDLKAVMNYRFDHNIGKHTIGNLVLAACTEIYGNMQNACRAYCKILNVEQKVLPISNDSLHLGAEMESGTIIYGEHQICTYPEKIKRIFYQENAKILPEVLECVAEADAVIFSCGSLYTSILPNLLFQELIDVLNKNNGKIIYICNLMTQRGETTNYMVSEHVHAINQYLDKHLVDCVIVNNNYHISQQILNNYLQEDAKLVKLDTKDLGCDIIADNFVTIDEQGRIRHNLDAVCLHIKQYLNM